jgi:hypothetical protein
MVLSLPPLGGVYWGSLLLLEGIWSGRAAADTLRRVELGAASLTAFGAVIAPGILLLV